FTIASGVAHVATSSRVWTGVCSYMEQVQAEPTGLSTYFLKISPALWRTTLRRNNRIFQHRTIPEIVTQVLGEWQIEPDLHLDAQYPTFEYRVQYGETDFAFLSRLLEEAGIAYYFSHGEAMGGGKSPQSVLVLTDKPEKSDGRPGGPLPYVDNPNESAER